MLSVLPSVKKVEKTVTSPSLDQFSNIYLFSHVRKLDCPSTIRRSRFIGCCDDSPLDFFKKTYLDYYVVNYCGVELFGEESNGAEFPLNGLSIGTVKNPSRDVSNFRVLSDSNIFELAQRSGPVNEDEIGTIISNLEYRPEYSPERKDYFFENRMRNELLGFLKTLV